MHVVAVGLDDDQVAGRHHYQDVSSVPAGKEDTWEERRAKTVAKWHRVCVCVL